MVILNLIRIKDWLKNILIFFPLIFAGYLFNFAIYFELLLGFFTFSLVSSSIYILNDILDIEKDKLHPVKKYSKPLASNQVNLNKAYYILIFFIILSSLLIFLQPKILFTIISYIILSIIYNFGFKNIPFIEIVILAFGYVLRINLGSNIIEVQSSLLMLSAIFCLAIYFILLKRIGEINQKYDLKNKNTRNVLKYYNSNILKIYVVISIILLSSIIFAYILTINFNLIYSFILTIILLIKYFLLTKDTSNGENPINYIISNKSLLLLTIAVLVSSLVIYVK